MWTISFKPNKKAILLSGVVLCVLVCCTFYFFKRAERPVVDTGTSTRGGKTSYKVATNEERIAFLKFFGWEVGADPVEVEEVIIPEEFNDVYQKYNDIQKTQQLNLEKYKGKRVKRWCYSVANYPVYEGEVRANLLVYEGRVIGGDICSVELNGFMHGFMQEGAEQTIAELQRKQQEALLEAEANLPIIEDAEGVSAPSQAESASAESSGITEPYVEETGATPTTPAEATGPVDWGDPAHTMD